MTEATGPGLTPRLRVADLERWGRLIKSWATHLDYFDPRFGDQPPRDYWTKATPTPPKTNGPSSATVLDINHDGKPKPRALPPMNAVVIPRGSDTTVALPGAVALTAGEFRARLEAAGVALQSLPSQYKYIVVVQGSVDTMVIRLPPKDTLQGSEDDLLNGQPYPFGPGGGAGISGYTVPGADGPGPWRSFVRVNPAHPTLNASAEMYPHGASGSVVYDHVDAGAGKLGLEVRRNWDHAAADVSHDHLLFDPWRPLLQGTPRGYYANASGSTDGRVKLGQKALPRENVR